MGWKLDLHLGSIRFSKETQKEKTNGNIEMEVGFT